MGNFITRIRTALEAQANGIVDGIEDPRLSLDYSLTKLEENRREINRSLIEVMAAHKRLSAQRDQLSGSLGKLDQQAGEAVKTGRDDLARTAIERKNASQKRLTEMDAAIENLQGQEQTLKENCAALDHQIAFFRSKKEELKSLYDSSRAQLRIREAMTGVSHDLADVGNTIQRIEGRIQILQARTDAINQLVGEGYLVEALNPNADDLERQLTQSSRSQAVEEELARLKAQAGPQ